MTGKITIVKEISSVIDGRNETKSEEYYQCWCEISDLLSSEKYAALQQSLEETAVFKVRRCKKIEEMRMHLKEYEIVYNGDTFSIYSMTPIENESKYLFKGNRVS